MAIVFVNVVTCWKAPVAQLRPRLQEVRCCLCLLLYLRRNSFSWIKRVDGRVSLLSDGGVPLSDGGVTLLQVYEHMMTKRCHDEEKVMP